VARVLVPKNAKTDARTRVLLSDDEFERFVRCPSVRPELHAMAFASRTFGGMRTSDLHAWDWRHIDTETWFDAPVPRPKADADALALAFNTGLALAGVNVQQAMQARLTHRHPTRPWT
jgi:hypothetical protein